MYAKEYVTFEFLLASVRIKFYYKYFEYQNFIKQQFLYPPQGGSIAGFFLSITSSNNVNTGQLRSITVN